MLRQWPRKNEAARTPKNMGNEGEEGLGLFTESHWRFRFKEKGGERLVILPQGKDEGKGRGGCFQQR